MKTVKEYANSVGKSHQSVYKQLNSKKNRNRNVIVPLIPVKVNQKEKKDIRK